VLEYLQSIRWDDYDVKKPSNDIKEIPKTIAKTRKPRVTSVAKQSSNDEALEPTRVAKHLKDP